MITSKNGKITVLMDDNGRYLMGYVKRPRYANRDTWHEAHLDRCTRDRAKAKAWADREEARLKNE